MAPASHSANPHPSGRVYDAAGVGALCRAAGVPYMLDACQSVGQMPIDVRAIGCDFLSATGRKYLRAPRGTGLLFCRRYELAKLARRKALLRAGCLQGWPPLPAANGCAWRAQRTFCCSLPAAFFPQWQGCHVQL